MKTTEQYYIGTCRELAAQFGMPVTTTQARLLALVRAGLLHRGRRPHMGYCYKFPKAWEELFRECTTLRVADVAMRYVQGHDAGDSPVPPVPTVPPLDEKTALRALSLKLRGMKDRLDAADRAAKWDRCLLAAVGFVSIINIILVACYG